MTTIKPSLKRYRCVVEREYSQETGKIEHNATFYPDDKGVWVLYSDVEDLVSQLGAAEARVKELEGALVKIIALDDEATTSSEAATSMTIAGATANAALKGDDND